jgi:osmotically-inducible protein OsmY
MVLAAAAARYSPGADKKIETFNAYVDSDLCAHLMLGPISEARMECSKDTHKQGSGPVLVRLSDNLIFDVNKTKMIDPLVSQIVLAMGETKAKDGRIKLESASALEAGAIKPGTPGYNLVDARQFRLTGDGAKVFERVRHELAMLPYVSEFDFISFTMTEGRVILTGWTIRETNRSSAYNVVKNLPGVDQVINNIDVLPLGSMDMQVRASVRTNLQRVLSRYFWGSGSAIKIVVKNGNVILLGMVSNESDINLATIQANAASGAFKVFNMLRVEPKSGKASD